MRRIALFVAFALLGVASACSPEPGETTDTRTTYTTPPDLDPGNYEVTVQVTDTHGNSGTHETSINVSN